MSEQPTLRAIELNAYQRWLDEGKPDGRDRAHWLAAEGEVFAELTIRYRGYLDVLCWCRCFPLARRK